MKNVLLLNLYLRKYKIKVTGMSIYRGGAMPMSKDNEPEVFRLDYDDVAQHLFESLVSEGYAPSEDELLDLTDIVMDLLLHVHLSTGGEAELIIEEDSEEE
jgi:hypothetical protein